MKEKREQMQFLPSIDKLNEMVEQLKGTEEWCLGESLFEKYPDVRRLNTECAFPLREMPYKGNVVEFDREDEKYGFVRSTLATAIRYGLPYVYQERKNGGTAQPIKFGTVVACIRPEDILSIPVPGIRKGVFAQADLEYVLELTSPDKYVNLNTQLIQDSVRWLVSLGLSTEQIQVRINNFTGILFSVLGCDKSTVSPLLVQAAWQILNEVDRCDFEGDYETSSRLKENARTLLQLSSDQGIIDTKQRQVITGWVNEGAYNADVLEEFPNAKRSFDTLKEIKTETESNLQGSRVVISPNSYRITPYGYSGVTFQIDAIGLNGTPIAEIAGGGDYSQTVLNYWQTQYGKPDGNICFTGIAFGLMRVSTLLKK